MYQSAAITLAGPRRPPPAKGVSPGPAPRYAARMFSVEHEFDATIVTLVDEGETPLQEDVVISSFEECVTVEQYDPRTDRMQKITLSITQMQDLVSAVTKPEGVWRRGG